MGICASVPSEGLSEARGTSACHPAQPVRTPVACSRPAPPPAPSSSNAAAAGPKPSSLAAPGDLITEVQGLQSDLAEVSHSPLLGLVQAAEIISAHLKVELVAIWGISKEEPGCLVLLAAHGIGAAALERRPVTRVPPSAIGNTLSIPDLAAPGAAKQLLPHLAPLLTHVRSLVAAPVGGPEAPLGVMVLASRAPCSFDGVRWQMRRQAGAMGVLRMLTQLQVEHACCLMRAVDDAAGPLAAMNILLRAAPRLMSHASNMRMAVRVAIARPPAGFGSPPGGSPTSAASPNHNGHAAGTTAASDAILFEQIPRASLAPRSSLDPSARGGSLLSPGDAGSEVTASPLPLRNTLLGSALRHRQARFVRDCGAYMQSCSAPARDVFSRASDLVMSLVVLPLYSPLGPKGGGGDDAREAEDRWLGGLYFALDTACDFANLRDTLLGFAHLASIMLNCKVAGQVESLEAEVTRAAERRSLLLSSCSDGSATDAAAAGDSGGSGGSPVAAPSSRISFSGSTLNTDAMLQVLQQEVRKGWRRGAKAAFLPELSVTERLGHGGFGCVYKGFWHNNVAAIKVMAAHRDQAVSGAMEMAVLSSVQHPNIVQVYACLTDVVETADCSAGASSGSFSGLRLSAGSISANPAAALPALPGGPISCPLPSLSPGLGGLPPAAAARAASRVRFRRLAPDEAPAAEAEVLNVLVMEFCNLGTLRDALRRGRFHARLPSGAVGVDLASAVEVLLDTAYALKYLHDMQLIHGDIKPENLLLKSDPSRRPLGFTVKLSDFGLARTISDEHRTINLSGCGTVTHLAPEMFVAGSAITTAVDIYAYGILMWEVYTGGARPYEGLSPAAIAQRVHRGDLRPRFPRATPPAFAGLAADCWRQDPAARPSFGDVAARLEALHAELTEAAAAAAS